jgi:hypothetical protein
VRSPIALVALMLVLALLLIGCEPADCIYPLYNPNDTASDDRLLGTWQPVAKDTETPDKDQRWNFVHAKEDKSYDFTLGALGLKGGFAAKLRLVGIGNYLFVDFQGEFERTLGSDKLDNLMAYPAVPTHGIGRIWLKKDALRIHFLNDDWTKDHMKAGMLTLAHLAVRGYPLITATTEDLRKFMQAHAEDTEALSENYELKRIK